MEFRTPLHISPSKIRIDHNTKILTMGSCFANVMGENLQQNKFKAEVNPFGVIFNPLSIFKILEASSTGKDLLKGSYVLNSDIWYNYDLHSDFSGASKEELEQKVSEIISKIHSYLKSAKVLTITLGTAFVYRLTNSNEIVANCHKIPASNFKKELLTTNEITFEFEKVYAAIKKINPSIQFIFTVSPVRHIKDGIEQNSVSKSILRTSCHFLQEKFEDIEYFPSYEIMMDDLRDYRFYKEDMIHPNEVAEKYIWEKFLEKHIEKKSIELIKEWEGIRRAIEHKPFHPESPAHQKFLKETIRKAKELCKFIDVQAEVKLLENKLLP